MKRFNVTIYGKEWEKTKEVSFKDIEESKNAVINYLEKNYQPLDFNELETLGEWLNEESTIVIFENENEEIEEIKELLINNEHLEYITTSFLLDNLKDEIKQLHENGEKNSIFEELFDTIKEKSIHGATKLLSFFIDLDGLAYDINRLDGIGHMLNYYDSKELEIKHNNGEWHKITLC